MQPIFYEEDESGDSKMQPDNVAVGNFDHGIEGVVVLTGVNADVAAELKDLGDSRTCMITDNDPGDEHADPHTHVSVKDENVVAGNVYDPTSYWQWRETCACGAFRTTTLGFGIPWNQTKWLRQ
jgi:hypothetical protein